jgi:hypothetical protein
VRSGPGLQFPVIALWLARNPIQVIGRSADGFWLAVQSPWFVGWMAASVVVVTGPCDTVPVIEFSAPPPAATATPGLPAATPTPMAMATEPEGPTETSAPGMTVQPTETKEDVLPTATSEQPTATEMQLTATATVTATATLELTPEVTAAAGG